MLYVIMVYKVWFDQWKTRRRCAADSIVIGDSIHTAANTVVKISYYYYTILCIPILWCVYRQSQTRETIVIIMKSRTRKSPPTLELSKTVPNANLFLVVFLFIFFFFVARRHLARTAANVQYYNNNILFYRCCCSDDVRTSTGRSTPFCFSVYIFVSTNSTATLVIARYARSLYCDDEFFDIVCQIQLQKPPFDIWLNFFYSELQ